VTSGLKPQAAFLAWGEQRPDWTTEPLPLADQFGWHRAHYGMLEGTNVRTRVVTLPFGQASPPHSVGHEVIIFQLEGETVFLVGPDRARFRLRRYDALFIPAGVIYEYWNAGPENVLFLVVNGRIGEWPTHATYYLPGRKEPLKYFRAKKQDRPMDPVGT
jgi:quercetin dioxygenase-like cupin family protein